MGVEIKDVIWEYGKSPIAFTPGEQLRGIVILRSTKNVQINGITVRVRGKERVLFRTKAITWYKKKIDPATGQKRTLGLGGMLDVDFNSVKLLRHTKHASHYKSKEIYLDTTLQLSGEETLPAVETSYPFTLMLPSSLPSSFTSKYSSIKYTVKVRVSKVEVLSKDEKFKKEFQVVSRVTVDERILSRVHEPTVHQRSKEFKTLFISNGKIFLRVTLPGLVVSPLSVLTVEAELSNESDVDVSHLHFSLISRLACVGRNFVRINNMKFNDMTLAEEKCEGVPKRNSRSWRLDLNIPQVEGINLDSSSFIKFYTLIVVKAVAAGLHRDLVMFVPIMINSLTERDGEAERYVLDSTDGLPPYSTLPRSVPTLTGSEAQSKPLPRKSWL